ncbi:MAG TPA: UDP-N-acetylglucosamine 2-epimerase (non-hydrolyzing), partial [Candidatus Acidoferrum sp.]|nr:UDP-N-acetylglucosamine 2-epimerase (non-hydrolyzing) [Candidatus Acidoferrum sp.]
MSDKLRVMTVFGTRPDTIKMAPVVHALAASDRIEASVCVTAQHRQMLDDLLHLFEITTDHDLDVMTSDQTLTEITTRVLTRMEPVLQQVRPDVVLVHGDTTTSTAAALAAFYQRIAVGHVEAGLRTNDPWMPFPEEMNRRLTGTIGSYHFAPTNLAREHLLREHVPAADIAVTGNTVIDAFFETARRPDLLAPPRWNELDPGRPIVVVTAHRRENHEHMASMCRAMAEIAGGPSGVQIYWPVHPSPRVAPIAHEVLDGVAGVVLVEPIDYAQMVYAVRDCSFVLTDSGGLQEEAPCLGKPVLVMREETERPEGLEAGTLELVGHDRVRIVEAARRLLEEPDHYTRMSRAVNPYGDGQAANRI